MLATIGRVLRYGPMAIEFAMLAVAAVEALGAAASATSEQKRKLASKKVTAALETVKVELPAYLIGAAVDLAVFLLNVFTARSWTKGAADLADAAAGAAGDAELKVAGGGAASTEADAKQTAIEQARAEFAAIEAEDDS
jgi:hypothetical protein